MSLHLTEAFLYEYMPGAEQYYLSAIPEEEALSHEFSRGFLHRMRRLIREERRTPVMRDFVKYSRRAAVVLVLLLTLTFTTVVSVDALRTRFFEVVTRVYHEITRLHFFEEKTPLEEETAFVAKVPTYVPAGFSMIASGESAINYYAVYENAESMQIIYQQDLAENLGMGLDTEDTSMEKIYIGVYEGRYFSNKEEQQLILFGESYVYHLMGPVSKEELVKMAESIVK